MTKPLADAARAVVPTDVVVDGRGVRWYEVPVEQIDNLRAALAAHDAAREGYRERAREIARDVQRQNWKLGGSLVMDSDEAEEKIATALVTAAAEARAAQRREDAEIARRFDYISKSLTTPALLMEIAAAIEAGGGDQQRRVQDD